MIILADKKYFLDFIVNESDFDENFKNEYYKSYKLLKELCPKKVVNHCLAVSEYVYELGNKIKENYNIDLKKALLGSLLHDIGRSVSHNMDHGIIGANILRERGYNEDICLIVERHIGAGITKDECIIYELPPKDYIPTTIEEKIVAHCDNFIKGTKRVDVDYYLNKLKNCDSEEDKTYINRILELNGEINKLLI